MACCDKCDIDEGGENYSTTAHQIYQKAVDAAFAWGLVESQLSVLNVQNISN